jgi:hypothetical protein
MTMKLYELKTSLYTFSYKKRRWYKGGFNARYMKYEIHTYTGDRTMLVSPDLEIDERTFKFQF